MGPLCGAGGWFGYAGGTPGVDGEKAGAELPGRALARRRQNEGQQNLEKRDEFVGALTANPGRQPMEGGGTEAMDKAGDSSRAQQLSLHGERDARAAEKTQPSPKP